MRNKKKYLTSTFNLKLISDNVKIDWPISNTFLQPPLNSKPLVRTRFFFQFGNVLLSTEPTLGKRRSN